jgi:hypothetical protein
MNAEPPPNNGYLCEARETGKPPFEFPTPDGDSARAMCDAHGWELIRIYQPGKDSDRPATSPGKGDPMLSKKQLQAVAIESSRTFRYLDDMDLADGMAEDDWRRAQIQALVGRKGLSACQNSHYMKLMKHFRGLRGVQTAGPVTGGQQSGEGGDTLERREQILKLIAQELGSHARRVMKPESLAEWKISELVNASTSGIIGEAYLLGIARNKNPGCTITDVGALITLPSSKLEHLHFTLRNRIAAREGRGESGKRNKGQGGKGKKS